MPEFTDAANLEFSALRSHSSRLGSDALQIQGAGGNTSIKLEGVLWIKASGKWLMHANDENLFVPVQRKPLLQALEHSDPRAEKSVDFIVDELNPHGLRPSIETTLHAVMTQRVVIHVHCVDTIALAILKDAEQKLADRLSSFNWAFIPYTRPGLPLSRSIAKTLEKDTDVLVLGNHGLVVAAESVEECVELLQNVRLAVKTGARIHKGLGVVTDDQESPIQDSWMTGLHSKLFCRGVHRLDGSDDVKPGYEGYVPAQLPQAHAIAFDEPAMKLAAGGSLYPDHVIFLGEGTAIALPDENCDALVQRFRDAGKEPPMSVVFPDAGVAMLAGATAGQQAMARCLSDVCLRVAADANINYLSPEQNHELLNWEAEQYRQALNTRET